ncbi:MAG: ABC transporter permease [Tannerella sp.]|nr:ABC transporter permease [Tannerella sp.]
MQRILLYFKQVWNLLRQEKLFSTIYILGTGLSITLVMTLSVVFYIKIAGVYPETNRGRTLTVCYIAERNKDGRGYSSSRMSLQMFEACFKTLTKAETVSAEMMPESNENYVQPEGSRMQLPVTVKYVDPEWWNVFNFRFGEGAPFTEADFQSGITVAVISKSLANRLYGDEGAVGKSLSLNFRRFKVCGVVDDVSFLTSSSYAQIWLPYTVADKNDLNSFGSKTGSLGRFTAIILAPSAAEVEPVKQEFLARFRRYSSQYADEVTIIIPSQPLRQWEKMFFRYNLEDENFNYYLWLYGIVFFALMLVPAISLSGMADSRLERRLSEMGVRRAYGAKISSLMNQILLENFIFTLLGGIVGLCFAYFVVLTGKDWIMGIGSHGMPSQTDGWGVTISPSMLFNIHVFLLALAVCFLLNLFSALIPAWKASRHQIIESLNLK